VESEAYLREPPQAEQAWREREDRKRAIARAGQSSGAWCWRRARDEGESVSMDHRRPPSMPPVRGIKWSGGGERSEE
jgi:hypothetical protein